MDRFLKRSMKRLTSGDPMPTGHDIAFLKDRFLKHMSKSQFWLHKLSASGVISTYQRKSELSLLQRHAYWSLSMSLPNIFEIFQTIMKCTRFWLRNFIRGVNLKKEQKDITYPSCMWHSYLTWYYQIISNSMGVMACTIFLFWWGRGSFLLHVTHLLGFLFIPTKYESNLL